MPRAWGNAPAMADPAQSIVTIFGGGGFVGRYVSEALLRAGVRLRIAQRHPRRAYRVQTLGAVGQLSFISADVTRPASVARAVDGASAVINLVGILKGRFDAVHAEGAGAVASAAAAAGVEALVQISAIGADPASRSAYGRSKAAGERAVHDAFPAATIIRPSLVFGAEDKLTNRFASLARLPLLPVIAPATLLQPVYVRDLAAAIAQAALDPATHAGATYAIGGPDVMTMRQLNARIVESAGLSPTLINVPDAAAGLLAMGGFLPGAPLTRDQWAMLQQDNIVGSVPGIDEFGIRPTPLGSVAGQWLARYHPGGRFALPTQAGVSPRIPTA